MILRGERNIIDECSEMNEHTTKVLLKIIRKMVANDFDKCIISPKPKSYAKWLEDEQRLSTRLKGTHYEII